MSALGSTWFLAVVSAGLTAGILFGDRMDATFARRALSPSSFVSFQQVLHAHFVPLMPILMSASILAGLALVLIRSRAGRVEFVAVLLAVVGFIAVFVLTRLVNSSNQRTAHILGCGITTDRRHARLGSVGGCAHDSDMHWGCGVRA